MNRVNFNSAADFLEQANKVFEEQKTKIIRLLPSGDVQHIGGTSIPRSITKGDLDLLIRVPEKEFRNAVAVLKSLYEINQPENWSDMFASFKDEKNLGIVLVPNLSSKTQSQMILLNLETFYCKILPY